MTGHPVVPDTPPADPGPALTVPRIGDYMPASPSTLLALELHDKEAARVASALAAQEDAVVAAGRQTDGIPLGWGIDRARRCWVKVS
jgi:hypothetical protein